VKPASPYPNEQSLVKALQQKDRAAFSYVYDNYADALYGVIFKVVQSETIAADVWQEAFVKIWKNIGQYQPEKGSLFTWMLNICRNMAIDTLRSKQYRNETQNQPLEDYVYKVDAQEQVESKVDHIGLKEVVEKLKPEHKILIDKVYFEGYTQEEVSTELNIPLGTVKTRLRAAIKQLRNAIRI
jgi:RNA polymerase sigma-70 factor (ECF subfamily)